MFLIESLFKFFISAVHLFCISLCIQLPCNSISITQFPMYCLWLVQWSHLKSHLNPASSQTLWVCLFKALPEATPRRPNVWWKAENSSGYLGRFPQPYRVRHSFFFIICTCVSWWLYCFACNYPFHSQEAFPLLLHSWCKEKTSHGRCWFRQRWKSVPDVECCSPVLAARLQHEQCSVEGELSLHSPELVKQRPHTSFSIQLPAEVTRGHTDLDSNLGTKHKFGGLELIKPWKGEFYATLHPPPPAHLEPWHKQVQTRNLEPSQAVLGYFSPWKCSFVKCCLSLLDSTTKPLTKQDKGREILSSRCSNGVSDFCLLGGTKQFVGFRSTSHP